jgi:hypothetical protein
MAPPFWTADILSNVNHVIIIGWLALIFAPFNKLSKYVVLATALFLSVIYTIILFQTLFLAKSTKPSFDFFRLLEWLALCKDPFTIVGRISHFCVVDLWLGQWMVNDFYSSYTFAYSITLNPNGIYQVKKSLTSGRIIFTLILLLTYAVAPFGFLVYHLATFTFLQKYKANDPIDFQNEQSFSVKSNLNQLQTESSTRRPVRFGDKLPEPLQKIYHFILGIIGLIVLFTFAVPAYIVLRIYCRIKYRAPSNPSTTDSSLTPNKFIPDYVRNETAKMKLISLTTPLEKRNSIWYLKFLLLQLSTFIEYIPNATNPIALFTALNDYFRSMYNVRYFVFGDGIGVSSYDLVKRYLQDLPPHKGFESLGWQVSSSQGTFCDFTTIFLSSDNPEMKLGREIIFQWLHAFPYHLHENNPEVRFYLSRLVPRQIDQQPDQNIVYQAVGEVMFFLATGGELRKHEREAFIDCVKNPLIFFPNWFNFLLAGHYLERKNLNSYYTLLQAFSRYADRQALRAAFKAAGTQKSQLEVLKLVAIVFSIAGSAAPAKLAFAVIEKLWSNKEKNVPLFKKNPQNFIKECARLDKVVPMVNVLATNEIANEIETDFHNNNHPIKIPEHTPIHCSLVNANRDKNIFQNPDEFLPERPDLNKIIVWNGVEEDIMNKDKSKRPIRYCPGHDLSLDVIQYVAEQFLPVIFETNENYDPEKIIGEELGRILY